MWMKIFLCAKNENENFSQKTKKMRKSERNEKKRKKWEKNDN